MAIFKKEDIVGYSQDEKILCIDCAEEIEDLEQKDIITTDDLEKSDNFRIKVRKSEWLVMA